ncbi:acetylornithine aminotransferase mitochondrial precursor [Stemphylium lycopersici]|nr:acetylornithine aminotransferase mitochondrial precursor [Stemphylium lycopersici]
MTSRMASRQVCAALRAQRISYTPTRFASAASTVKGSSLPQDVLDSIARDSSLPTPDPPASSKTTGLVNQQLPYMVPTYVRPPPMFEKGEGCYMWDVENRRYLDFTAGIAVNALGHCDAGVAQVIGEQAKQLMHTSNLYHNPHTGLLSKQLIQLTHATGGFASATRTFICNSGSEANEAAIKFARKVGKSMSPDKDKHEFVSFHNSFHGRTMGSLSATPNPKYQTPFSPMVPGFKYGTFNDVDAVNDLVTDATCGVIVEPIQGEGGVNVATPEFLVALRKRCTEVGAVLIFDEIQCGLGRTGTFWAHAGYPKECHPDMVTTAKALGNGFPIGATIVNDFVCEHIKTGDHGTTFGGNPLGSRVASYILSRLSSPEILDSIPAKEQAFRKHFDALRNRFPSQIKEIRGKGLILGLQLDADPTPIVTAARERGLLIITCGTNTLRFVPPLTITEAEIEEGMKILEQAMESVWVEGDNSVLHGAAMTDHMNGRDESAAASSNSAPGLSNATAASTPIKSASSPKHGGADSRELRLNDIDRYVALGCLHFQKPPGSFQIAQSDTDWAELLHLKLPDEIRAIIGSEATRLLEARWVRLFLYQPPYGTETLRSIVRVYLLPEDWGRRSIDRNSKSLKAALRRLLQDIDISTSTWYGDLKEGEMRCFDPWASAELSSLYYLFNKLPSPSPDPGEIKSRYTRVAVNDLLESSAISGWEEYGEQALPGLRTRLYGYQARSAGLMLQREAAPQLQLDPRLEVRTSPNGQKFYFGARDGSFLQEPRYYEANRGGILAETMGLGKTVICLAVILASKHHLPQIPAAYRPPAPTRSRVGTLKDMAASILGRYSIPAQSFLEQSEANGAGDMTKFRNALDRNVPFYEIPPEIPRINRTTRIPSPRQLVLSSATIIVVPRNLLHQWQSEIHKHILEGGLKVLVVDTVPKRVSKVRNTQYDDDTMQFRSELPAPTELMKFDVVLFTRNRFEQEIQDGQDDFGRRVAHGVAHEGHSFSSSLSNAVLVAKQIQAERRWVVSGTPANNLVGIEVDMATVETERDPALQRELAIEKRKSFNLDSDNLKSAKALANLFIQVLRANAITSERTDVDYLFHKNSAKARHSLIRNLRQSNFTWTGFSLTDVISTLETSSKYLTKEEKHCSLEDAQSLLESSQAISKLVASDEWIALSKAHEMGMAIENWPQESKSVFALVYPAEPTMVGVTQLIEGQLHVDSNILAHDPTVGLDAVGHAARAKVVELAKAESDTKEKNESVVTGSPSKMAGVPSSLVGSQQPPTSKISPRKPSQTKADDATEEPTVSMPLRSKKRKLTFADETADLPADSPLHNTRILGTTSAKLSYLLDKVMQYQATEKIIIFYEGDNAAFYIAQCLELMYVNHRIYARTLNNIVRSEYVRLFNEDPDVRVLLIDVACGALGLNLNAASVVLIVNPINRPSIEAQAIKRAHRIGQTKEVLVETLVLENTIEHAIFNRAKKMCLGDRTETSTIVLVLRR